LLEGGEKAGKSYAAAQFSASKKVGQTYWIDLSEGAADEYGAIDDVRYLVVEHDGSWRSIINSVEAVYAEAKKAADAGEPPVVLVIDSMTAEWDLLKDWAAKCARGSKKNQQRLQQDPNAEIDVSMNYWNDATTRHRRLMTKLMTFPGIVIMIARGKETAALDANGRPIPKQSDYRVEGHKNLAFDASVWVRLSREHPPIIVGARSVHAGIRPGVDRPKPVPNFSLEWLIFDVLKCDPSDAEPRQLAELTTDDEAGPNDVHGELAPTAAKPPTQPAPNPTPIPSPAQVDKLIAEARHLDQLRGLWRDIKAAKDAGAWSPEEVEASRNRIELARVRITQDTMAEAPDAPVAVPA